MDHIFINENLTDPKPSMQDIVQKVAAGLMTPDMRAAVAAGCRFEVTMRRDGDAVAFSMRTIEKVSILKTQEGQPISVLVRR